LTLLDQLESLDGDVLPLTASLRSRFASIAATLGVIAACAVRLDTSLRPWLSDSITLALLTSFLRVFAVVAKSFDARDEDGAQVQLEVANDFLRCGLTTSICCFFCLLL
jgi:hypothetical protein